MCNNYEYNIYAYNSLLFALGLTFIDTHISRVVLGLADICYDHFVLTVNLRENLKCLSSNCLLNM